MFLIWRLETRRVEPLAHVRSGLGLPGLAKGFITSMSRGKALGFLAQAPGFVDEARFEGDGLLHSAALLGHGLLLPISSADAVTAIWMFGSSGPLTPFAGMQVGQRRYQARADPAADQRRSLDVG